MEIEYIKRSAKRSHVIRSESMWYKVVRLRLIPKINVNQSECRRQVLLPMSSFQHASPPLNDFSWEADDSALTSLDDFSYDDKQQPVAAIASPPFNNFSYEGDDSVLTTDNDLPCSCDIPTLQTIENAVRQWQKEWESESAWNEVFDNELGHARIEGEHTTITFLDKCAQHIIDGKELLESIHDVMHTHCSYCREQLKYDGILLYNLLVCVVSQVKFFEVKLDTGCN